MKYCTRRQKLLEIVSDACAVFLESTVELLKNSVPRIPGDAVGLFTNGTASATLREKVGVIRFSKAAQDLYAVVVPSAPGSTMAGATASKPTGSFRLAAGGLHGAQPLQLR